MWLIESRFKFVNVKGKVQDDLRLRNWHESYSLKELKSAFNDWFFVAHIPKGYVHGTLKVRVRKMKSKELEVFKKSGKLPERF